jgi:5-enolpyruvylshikimate-3-phosphate synthase
MSMALCGLVAPEPVVVEEAEILTESFPSFVPSLAALGVTAA